MSFVQLSLGIRGDNFFKKSVVLNRTHVVAAQWNRLKMRNPIECS